MYTTIRIRRKKSFHKTMKPSVTATMTFCFVVIYAPRFCTCGILQGWLTNRNNNPAFQCNPAPLSGETWEDVMVEARLNHFENEDDDTYTSEDCEHAPLDNCDVKVSMQIDANDWQSNWPQPEQHMMVVLINNWDGNDVKPDNSRYRPGSEQFAWTACKVVRKLSAVTIRVKLEDVDSVGTDIINQFNCRWAPKVGDVAETARFAKWTTINCCTSFEHDMDTTVRHEMKIDVRAFEHGSCPRAGRRA